MINAFLVLPPMFMAMLTITRHGWGIVPNPQEAVTYLSAAASNAASIEELALKAGMKKGGAAKGELVLAIFELANCFRHGKFVPELFSLRFCSESERGCGRSCLRVERVMTAPGTVLTPQFLNSFPNDSADCFLGWGVQVDKFAACRVRHFKGLDQGEPSTDIESSITRRPQTWAILVSNDLCLTDRGD